MALVCLYCANVFAGGGINRFKQHLAGAKGEVEQRRKCPHDVRHQMLLNLKGNAEKKRVREMQADFNPFNAQQREYEEMMIRQLEDDDDDVVTAMGPGYKGPNLHVIRGYYLAKMVDEVKIYVESYREIWKKTDVSKTTRLLYQLFREVVLLLMEEFPSIFWSLCAVHCINLILQDIGKLQSVCCVVEHAYGITKYIYNHCYPLYLMRKFTGGSPAPTCFATNFIVLQSILVHKDELRAMVTSRE
ncbi:uncharacterized protein LOC112327607 [Populus trichocarpa]|uniref:uncharacterized protein LOC112327607 n=1 Tax=Populus trichocarpa TaxID=3694 RepID=UPI0022775D8C|nr:uncharacterized protein LOC112327607 [Populus trichocarpa]